jgi:hypothetical protein
LSADVLEQIEVVHRLIGKYLGQNLELFEIDFMRAVAPERQVAIWSNIATAWSNYHDKFLGGESLPKEEEGKLIAALIAISRGEQDTRALSVSMPIATRLLACYGGLSSSGT